MSACGPCLRRSWLLARLAGRIEIASKAGRGPRTPTGLLALDDAALGGAVGADAGTMAAAAALEPDELRRAVLAAGLEATCRHDPASPARLADLGDPPAVLHHDDPAGLLGATGPAVGVVGARRATPLGLDVARDLGAGLADAGVTVISGMALGVDAAAHEGALAVGGPTVAVLPGGADVAYPASRARLHERLRAHGAVVAELPPGTAPRTWTFPARNRIIAALADVTVVVEAAARSGSLITARRALDLGRDVAAVPGPVRGGRSDGTNALLYDGAHVVRGVDDVLDLLGSALPGAAVGHEVARAPGTEAAAASVAAPPPERPAALVLARLRAGARTLDAVLAGDAGAELLVALTELEATGRVRRGLDGSYAAAPVRRA